LSLPCCPHHVAPASLLCQVPAASASLVGWRSPATPTGPSEMDMPPGSDGLVKVARCAPRARSG